MQITKIENLTRDHMNRQRTLWSLSLCKQNKKAERIADIGVQLIGILWEVQNDY